MQILAHAATVSAVALIFVGAEAPQTPKHSLPAVQPVAITQTVDKPAEQPVAKPTKPEPKIVSVQRGDTLSSIASANGTTWRRIYDKNTNINNPDMIFPDDKLTIPASDEKLTHRQLPAKTTSTNSTSTPTPASRPAVATSSPAPSAAPKPAPVVHHPDPAPAVPTGSVWDRLADCESSGNWAANTGNGFYGGLQFTLSSWRAVGGSGLPSNASRAEQIMRAEKLQAIQGWGAWPVCSVKVGLR